MSKGIDILDPRTRRWLYPYDAVIQKSKVSYDRSEIRLGQVEDTEAWLELDRRSEDADK